MYHASKQALIISPPIGGLQHFTCTKAYLRTTCSWADHDIPMRTCTSIRLCTSSSNSTLLHTKAAFTLGRFWKKKTFSKTFTLFIVYRTVYTDSFRVPRTDSMNIYGNTGTLVSVGRGLRKTKKWIPLCHRYCIPYFF